MANADEHLNQWLRDAHAMEQQAEEMLSAQASRLEHYPVLRGRIQEHLEETRSQRQRLETCMQRRGVSPSAMKDFAAKVTAMMQGVGGMMAGDEVVKGVLASYTFEHFEVGSYRILSAAAEAVGDMETARLCEEICREEERMASWLYDEMPEITATYLSRDEVGLDDEAKA